MLFVFPAKKTNYYIEYDRNDKNKEIRTKDTKYHLRLHTLINFVQSSFYVLFSPIPSNCFINLAVWNFYNQTESFLLRLLRCTKNRPTILEFYRFRALAFRQVCREIRFERKYRNCRRVCVYSSTIGRWKREENGAGEKWRSAAMAFPLWLIGSNHFYDAITGSLILRDVLQPLRWPRFS